MRRVVAPARPYGGFTGRREGLSRTHKGRGWVVTFAGPMHGSTVSERPEGVTLKLSTRRP